MRIEYKAYVSYLPTDNTGKMIIFSTEYISDKGPSESVGLIVHRTQVSKLHHIGF